MIVGRSLVLVRIGSRAVMVEASPGGKYTEKMWMGGCGSGNVSFTPAMWCELVKIGEKVKVARALFT